MNIYRYHKVRKCDICGTTRTSLEFLNHHISVEHAEMADIIDKDVGTPQEITFESLKPDINGLFTIFLVTDAQYPTLRHEFRKSGVTDFEICSGRYEGSFLISFRNAADLWSALCANKKGLLGLRNFKLVFEDDAACEAEDDHEEDDDCCELENDDEESEAGACLNVEIDGELATDMEDDAEKEYD